MEQIRAKTKREFREKMINAFSSPYNRHNIDIVISRWQAREGCDWDVYRIDKTAIGQDRRHFIGVRAYDEEEKEYFFIRI